MTTEIEKQVCGIVMPISANDGCSESHWADVLDILKEAIEDAGFVANLVSNADDIGVIHKRIIQNLYDNPVVVCDLSGKNPNVMFELGIRLAFDKPTVIVKDDKTTYAFDTSAIEHLEYPRDLRFARIVEFKAMLAEKINATYEKACTDPNFSTFLKHFGEFTVPKIDKKEVPGQEFILEELRGLRSAIQRMERYKGPIRRDIGRFYTPLESGSDFNACMDGRTETQIAEACRILAKHPSVMRVETVDFHGHKHIVAELRSDADVDQLNKLVGARSRRLRSRVDAK